MKLENRFIFLSLYVSYNNASVGELGILFSCDLKSGSYLLCWRLKGPFLTVIFQVFMINVH